MYFIFVISTMIHENCGILQKNVSKDRKFLLLREIQRYASPCSKFDKMKGVICTMDVLDEHKIGTLLFSDDIYVPAGMLTGNSIDWLCLKSCNITVAENFLAGVCYLRIFRVDQSKIQVKCNLILCIY